MVGPGSARILPILLASSPNGYAFLKPAPCAMVAKLEQDNYKVRGRGGGYHHERALV